ncbi:PDZ domain-containing protein [Methylocystis heyeri]|uniref:PDZ domain-containing protein n=1 Tax=Methylocystis heyeri TaxID=391905 RepID=A0A6B8KIC9_9HYPH|nr:PDZ domain-containing protein [Methylocystis heyeri]QGM46283.1 PDZ domain-containing protein [Methylocystis heyeri]
MSFGKSFAVLLALLLACDGAGAAAKAPRRPAPKAARALPFRIDAGRILLEATFKTPDGKDRKALVWFNMGMKAPILTKALYRELGLAEGAPLRLIVGDKILEAGPGEATEGYAGFGGTDFSNNFGPHPVEAMLPARLFLDYRLTLDYNKSVLSLSSPDGPPPKGPSAPIAVNPETGLASVEAMIDGHAYAFVIDAGSGYSWMRGAVLSSWLEAHPQWRRAEGAMGPANYNMLDFDFEKRGTLARLPVIMIGDIELKDVGVLGTAPTPLGAFVDGVFGDIFWDNWQKSAAAPVVGWLGQNAFSRYELTIDYPNKISYWRATGPGDAEDLDSPGVTLVRREGRYFIGGLVKTEDAAAPQGVALGDELVAVDDLSLRDASKGAVLAALHGKPGEKRRLTLFRDGAARTVEAPVLDLQ